MKRAKGASRSAPAVPAARAARAGHESAGDVDWPFVLVVAAVLAALWIVVRIATQDFVFGSRAGGWFHPYNRTLAWSAFALFAGVASVASLLTWLADREVERREPAVLLGWFIAAAPLQLLLRGRSRPLEAIVLSDDANSFWSPALRFGALEFLENFLQVAKSLPQHAGSNMPGKVLLYDLLQQLTVSPSAIAWILLGLSNLGGVFLYFVVRDLFRGGPGRVASGRRAGLFAMILYFFLPAKLFFFPLLNAVTPALILACLWLHLRFLVTGRAAWAVGLGVALYVVLLFEPLPLAAGFVFAALFFVPSLPGSRTPQAALRTAARSAGLAVAGFAALHLLLLAAAGFDILSVFVHQVGEAQKFNVHAARPYGIWAVQNLVDFVVSVGPAVVVVAAGGAVLAFFRDGLRSPAFLFGAATVLTVAALDLAGINRGETHRLWIFLTAFVVVNAAVLLSASRSVVPMLAVTATLILQVAVTLDVIGFM
jgi:hypothetical protein